MLTIARSIRLQTIAVLLGGFLSSVLLAQVPQWQAGFATERITPTEALWMSGYANRDRPAEGTRTELWAKAMALEDEAGKRVVLITMDLIGIDREFALIIRNQIAAENQLDIGQVVLNCSHTHTGPVVGRNLQTMYDLTPSEFQKIAQYSEQLQVKVPQLAQQALRNLQPAILSASNGQATFGVNRRNNPEPLIPANRSQGKLRGPVDYSVPVLRVDDGQHRLQGVVFGYACHATVLSDYEWSGDYPGYAQSEIERMHPGIIAMFWAGCGSDINPLPRRKPELAQQYGNALAAAVQRCLDGVTNPVLPTIKTAYREIPLPYDTLPSPDELKSDAQNEDRYIAARARHWLNWLEAGNTLPQSYPYPITIWRFGEDLNWIFLGGEVVVDYALQLKRSIPGHVWIAGYSNDVMAYIPSKRVWTEGGYEGATAMIYYGLPARWADTVESEIFSSVESLFKSLEE